MFLYVLGHLGAFRPEGSVRDTPSVTHIFGGRISRLDEKKHHQKGECSHEYSWTAIPAGRARTRRKARWKRKKLRKGSLSSRPSLTPLRRTAESGDKAPSLSSC